MGVPHGNSLHVLLLVLLSDGCDGHERCGRLGIVLILVVAEEERENRCLLARLTITRRSCAFLIVRRAVLIALAEPSIGCGRDGHEVGDSVPARFRSGSKTCKIASRP